MSERRKLLVLVGLILLVGALTWAVMQTGRCQPKAEAMALSCAPGYEPRQRTWLDW